MLINIRQPVNLFACILFFTLMIIDGTTITIRFLSIFFRRNFVGGNHYKRDDNITER